MAREVDQIVELGDNIKMDETRTESEATLKVITPDNPPANNKTYAPMAEAKSQSTLTRRDLLTSVVKVAAPLTVVGTMAVAGAEQQNPGTIQRWLKKIGLGPKDPVAQTTAPIAINPTNPTSGMEQHTVNAIAGMQDASTGAPLSKDPQKLGVLLENARTTQYPAKASSDEIRSAIANAGPSPANYNEGNPAPTSDSPK